MEVEGVEKYETIPGGLAGLVIGEVLTCEKHPDADRLNKTTVDIGGQIVPIVCGAANVAAGQKVVVATVGATLYPADGESFQIKKAKIRGEVSEGMICAEDEIGLGTSHDGIMVLDTDLPNGTPAADYFEIKDDVVLEIGLTPNRADAASHLGVARDIKAVTGRPICIPSVAEFKVNNQKMPIKVTVDNAADCPRYAGVTISGVKVGTSPEWLQHRLKSIGLDPINNVVDVTNYILHELGQPLHAFDATKIAGSHIQVKKLAKGTKFTTLDDKERQLSGEELMICDANGGLCMAGIFGGKGSGVNDQTQDIFLESAYFSPDIIRKGAQHHGLKTDASFRFERGTDPDMVIYALKKAALLIQELAGGEISSEIVDIYPNPISKTEIHVTYAYVAKLIGKELAASEIKQILERLDIEITNEDDLGFTGRSTSL